MCEPMRCAHTSHTLLALLFSQMYLRLVVAWYITVLFAMAPAKCDVTIFLSFSRDLCVFVAQKPLSDNKRLIRTDVSQI